VADDLSWRRFVVLLENLSEGSLLASAMRAEEPQSSGDVRVVGVGDF